MKNYVEGKVVVITGGAAGLGLATAKALAALGAKIVIADLNEEGGKKAVKELEESGGQVKWIKTDVTSEVDTKAMVQFAVDQFGRIDCLINSAGIMPVGEFVRDGHAGKWTKAVEVNLNGTINTVHSAISVMLNQQGKIPHIIAFASTAARKFTPGAGVYGATKIAVKWLMDSLRPEFAGKIKFTTFYPGATGGTELTKTHQAAADDRFFGAKTAPFSPEEAERAATDPDHDKPMIFCQPSIIADEVAHILNQPEGVYITDQIVTFSNDPS